MDLDEESQNPSAFEFADGIDDEYGSQVWRKRSNFRNRYLYGIGSRGKLPCTRQSINLDDDSAIFPSVRKSAVPPGAHGDVRRYAILLDNENPVTSEKLMMMSSSCLDGVDIVRDPQPPWYAGGSSLPYPISPTNCSQRYGFRGSYATKEYNSRNTFNHLNVRDDPEPMINEWVPPLTAVPMSTKHPYLCSPKLWPSNCEYVTGFHSTRTATKCSSVYLHDTTVLDDVHDHDVCSKLKMVASVSAAEWKEFKESSDLEMSHAIQSRPATSQREFLETYSSPIATKKPKRQSSTITNIENAKKKDFSGLIFSGGDAIVLQSTAVRQRMNETHKKDINYDTVSHKWKQTVLLHQTIATIVTKRLKFSSNLEALSDISSKCRCMGIKSARPCTITREEFVAVMAEILKVSSVSPSYDRVSNVLFSAFDVNRVHRLRYVHVSAQLTLLLSLDLLDAITRLWTLYDTYSNDQPTMVNLKAILTGFAMTEADVTRIEALFDDVLRKKFYAISSKRTVVENQAIIAASPKRPSRDFAIEPIFNICSERLTVQDVVSVIVSDTAVHQFFDQLFHQIKQKIA